MDLVIVDILAVMVDKVAKGTMDLGEMHVVVAETAEGVEAEVPDDQEVPGGLPLQKGGVANGQGLCLGKTDGRTSFRDIFLRVGKNITTYFNLHLLLANVVILPDNSSWCKH
ncbi:hypothetical protein EB796_011430 [Bugula neritina]|uniref:Uncharacterized protein n=1 Tax=Bugula neritina TaxID=10212 RepID=A0A7J7JY57_BUGNE|nr:hypothetical protein EB796_011430 [Bugula neritina]